jgi:GNAT superfamily N-acetyltransferase
MADREQEPGHARRRGRSADSKAGSRLELVNELIPSQIDQLVELYRKEWWTTGRQRSDVARMLAGSDVVLALQEPTSRRLAAFARALTDGVFKALVFDVIVDPAYRGQGAGRVIMDALMDHPALANVRHVELYCLPELAPFYRRWGFSEDVGGIRFMRALRA